MERIEDIILRHSQRGMLKLKEHLSETYCEKAAREILSWEKGVVFITTGFYVAGYPETDGPAGAYALSHALQKLGYRPVIVTEDYCNNFFEEEGIEVVYVSINAHLDTYCKMLLEWRPVGIIAIEKCGLNIMGDYANMKGISIREHTASVDLLFQSTTGEIPSIGVGDGGNEIGMGNLSGVIMSELSIVPCVTHVDHLVIASVSNWGAYGIAAYLELLTGIKVMLTFQDIYRFIDRTVQMGSVDGVTKEKRVSVDGYPISVEQEIIEGLLNFVRQESVA